MFRGGVFLSFGKGVWSEACKAKGGNVGAVLLGLALIGSAQASTAGLQHFDFKGVKPTDTRAMHQPKIEKCERYFKADGCTFKDKTVAGIPLNPKFMFADDGSGLRRIRGDFLASSYPVLLSSFKAKWGEPTAHTNATVQNGYGATLTIPSTTWEFVEGVMTITGPDFKGWGSIHYRSRAVMEAEAEAAKPKVDF